MEECEVKFLNIDPVALEASLLARRATKQFDRVYRRTVYDYPDRRLDRQGAWIRVRDEGYRVTLTYKQRVGMKGGLSGAQNDDSMQEIEVTVNDYGATCEFLETLGLTVKFYQENRRVRFMLDEATCDIDRWPKLSPYLEIEGPSWKSVDAAIATLGLDPSHKKIFSANQIYRLAGIEPNDYLEMTFGRMTKRGCPGTP